MHTRDQSYIFSTGGKFRTDYGLLLELHTLILVARSYALLMEVNGEALQLHAAYKKLYLLLQVT